MVSKWKLQAVTPDTCDPPSCKYVEMYDIEQPPPRTITVVAFMRVCPAHATTLPVGKMLWQDGNWKNLNDYIDYQRRWFRRLNHVQWLEKHPNEPLPSGIVSFTSDPVTPGSIPAPPQIEIDNMNQAYNLNKEHNRWKNQAVGAIKAAIGEDPQEVSWEFSGVGANRTMVVTSPDLSVSQRNQARSAMDIQFGPGKVSIDR